MASKEKRTYTDWMKLLKRRVDWKAGKKDPRVESRSTKPINSFNTK